MIKRITMVMLTLFAFGCLGWAANRTWTGTVSDSIAGPSTPRPARRPRLALKSACQAAPSTFSLARGKCIRLMIKTSSRAWAVNL